MGLSPKFGWKNTSFSACLDNSAVSPTKTPLLSPCQLMGWLAFPTSSEGRQGDAALRPNTSVMWLQVKQDKP